jgi:hypothetical protein
MAYPQMHFCSTCDVQRDDGVRIRHARHRMKLASRKFTLERLGAIPNNELFGSHLVLKQCLSPDEDLNSTGCAQVYGG